LKRHFIHALLADQPRNHLRRVSGEDEAFAKRPGVVDDELGRLVRGRDQDGPRSKAPANLQQPLEKLGRATCVKTEEKPFSAIA
jgi:hypothetical protein